MPEYFSYTNFGRTAPAKSLTASSTEMTIDTVDFERSRRSSGARTSRPIVTGTVNNGGITATSTNFQRLDEGRMLVMNPSAVLDVDEAIIAVDLLQLQDGTELRIANNVKYLTILARSITIGDNTSITWESTVPASPGLPAPLVDGTGTSHSRTQVCAHSTYYAADGGAGDDYPTASETGYPGDDAPTVEVWSLDAVALPKFELKGGEGGIGQRGGDGGDGGHGAKGSDSYAIVCVLTSPGTGATVVAGVPVTMAARAVPVGRVAP